MTDNSSSSDDDSMDLDNVLILPVKAISIVLMLALICGLNYLVAYTLHTKSHYLQQSAGNRFVFCLSVSNFIFGAVVLPFNFISCIVDEWIFGIMMCNLTGFVTMTVFTGSMISVVVITIDRYYAIVQPLLYPIKITNRRTKELIIVIWLMSLFGSLPPLFGWSRYTWLKSTSNCLVQWDIDPSFAYTFTSVFLIAPQCIMCYCYGQILEVARLTSRRTSNGNIASSTEYNLAQRRRSRRTSLLENIRMNSPTKAIRTVTITIGTLMITIVPLTAVIIYQAIFGVESIPAYAIIPATWLFFCSFVANSCIYAVWNKRIRRELLGYFCARGRCMDDDDNPSFHAANRRKSSKAISISESISEINGLTSVPKEKKSSAQCEQDEEITNDSGTVVTSIEDSECINNPESSCLSSKYQPKATRRKRSPLSSYRDGEVQHMLPVVAEVHLPGATDLDEGEFEITERS